MDTLKEAVKYGKIFLAKGYVAGPGGNISIRADDVAYMSPSGFALDSAEEEDYVPVEISTGKPLETKHKSTSETPFHLAVYRTREDVNAIVHAHPPYVTGLVSGGRKVEPMTPDFVAYLDHVEVIDYIVPAGEELAAVVAGKIKNCNCLAMSNHGALTVGANIKEAYYRMDILEQSCKVQLAAIMAGSPRIFNEAQVEEIRNMKVERYRRKILAEGKV